MNDTGRTVFRFEGFMLDRRGRSLYSADRLINLRPKSFDVLCCLVEHAGQLVTKSELIDSVWPNVEVTEESVTRCISDIRLALEDSEQHIIKTLPRRGYMFAAVVEQILIDPPTSACAATTDRHWALGRSRLWRTFVGIVFLLVAFAVSAWWLWRPESPPISEQPSVAVLPLVNLNGDANQDYLSDGITEDLIVSLSKYDNLFVIARSSAFQYKGKMIDARQIGQELRVRYLLQGSLRKDSSERQRITAQFIDTASGRQLWSESYDSEPSEIFTVQDELVQKIVTTLVAHLSKTEIEQALRRAPETPTAYDFYLRGNALMHTMQRETRGTTLAQARALYQQAVAVDQRYALAMQALANTYLMAWLEPSQDHPIGREFQQSATIEQAQSLAQQAVDLDASSAEAQATLGWILYWQNQMNKALAAFDRALQLNPNLVDGHYAIILSHGGRAPEAIDYAQRIMRLDPFHPPNYPYYLGKAYFFVGRYEEAFELIEPASKRMPSNRPPLVLLTAVAALTNRQEKAQVAATEVLRVQPDFTISGWLKFIRLTNQEYADRLTQGLRMAGLPE
jgi:adenylate cyclase